jgi:hypothetical protein
VVAKETRESGISVPGLGLTHLLLRCWGVCPESLPDRFRLAMINSTPFQPLLSRLVPTDVINRVVWNLGRSSRIVVGFPPVDNGILSDRYGVGYLVTVMPVTAGDVVSLKDADVFKVIGFDECLVA